LESLTDKLAGVASQDQVGQLARAVANQEQLAELADTLKKLSRTQFKTNTLGETREQQIENALSTLQGIIERREEIREQQPLRDRQRLEELRVEARGELAADFLPALDSLELALESGASLLAKYRQEVAGWDKVQSEATVQEKPTPPSGFWQKIRRQLAAPGEYPSAPVLPEPQPKPPLPQSLVEMADVVEAWLKGLALVQERFLALLANEEIQLILAHHQPFDPRLHVALETETREDMPPNTVVRVLRKGYRQRDRILRYAEVVVSRASTQPEIRSEIRSIENAQNVEKTEPEL
jgi:molecular chaperone GrpE (heat shock protein)